MRRRRRRRKRRRRKYVNIDVGSTRESQTKFDANRIKKAKLQFNPIRSGGGSRSPPYYFFHYNFFALNPHNSNFATFSFNSFHVSVQNFKQIGVSIDEILMTG